MTNPASNKPMTPFTANPFIFIFSVVLLVAVLGYYAWGAVDHLGLTQQQASATVVDKHYNPPGETYRTTIAAGRAWTQADPTPDTHVLALDVAGQEPTVAIVGKDLYDALQPGDKVNVRMHRTRLTRRLEVTDVTR
ncbi:hypothetical protein [Variovorax rhizosphaerae]|uniref:Uncharacterized protein n=1 Tax=Variovorax rhizosphaerae TaxID=1836200 RepID=A0ABU8WC11_9BURK